MTRIYFVRHAQPLHSWEDDRTRPLTEEGLRDTDAVLHFFEDKKVDAIYCSPYKRSMDTIQSTVRYLHKEIITDERLREREAGRGGNVPEMFQKRWADRDYHEEHGESIRMVQRRNVEAVEELVARHDGEALIIGTHGTALSSIVSHYDPALGMDYFMRIVDWMPYIIELQFEEGRLVNKIERLHIEKGFENGIRAQQPAKAGTQTK